MIIEQIWTTDKILVNTTIKKFLLELNESEARVFVSLVKAIYPSPELTHICNVLVRIFDVTKTVEKVNWPAEIKAANSTLLSALKKVLNSTCFNVIQKEERSSSHNPMQGRIKQYPIWALFCQRFGGGFEDVVRPLIYILHFVLIQISLHNEWQYNKKLSLLNDLADSLRKIVSCSDTLSVSVPIDKITYIKISTLLLKLYEEKYISFQENLLRAWSEFCDDKLFIRKVGPKVNKCKKQVKDKPKKKKLITTTQNSTWVEKSPIFLEAEEEPVSGDEVNSVEIFAVVTKDDFELDNQTKNAIAIYGCRLSLVEKLHLPWRTNALAEHEVIAVVSYLRTELSRSDPVAVFLSLVLLTSKPSDEVSAFNICSQMPDLSKVNEAFIDLESGVWYRKSIEMPSAFSPSKEQEELLAKHSDWLALPLPCELVQAIKALLKKSKHDIKKSLKIEGICFSKGDKRTAVLADFLKPIWKNNPCVHRRITPAAIRSTAFEKITHKFDGGYAALMLANTEFDNSTTLYYLSEITSKLRNDYIDVISSIGFTLNDSHSHDTTVVGSKLAIDKDKVANVTVKKRELLANKLSHKNLCLEELINRHNELVCYTLYTLIAATGHRSRTEFGFNSLTQDEVNNLSLLSDKINFVDSAIRLIPLSQTAQKQLTSYKNHCAELAKVMRSYDVTLATQLAKASTLSLNDEPDFFRIINHAQTNEFYSKSVGYKDVEFYLAPEINLPLNFIRHYFCSSLRENGQFSHAKSLMGHVGNGEHILSDHSLAVLGNLTPVANSIDISLKSLGIEAVEFSPIKGPKVEVIVQNIDLPFKSACLKRSEMTERVEQIQWVRKVISPHISSLRNVKTHDKTVDMLLNKVISDHESGITRERRVLLFNRFVSKIVKNNRWFSTSNEEYLLNVDANLLLDMRQALHIKKEINQWLLTPKSAMTSQDKIARIWCSLIVNSKMNVPTNIENLKIITSPPFYENEMAWFEVPCNKSKKTKIIHIDSISLLLMQKYDVSELKVKSAKGVKNSIYTRVLHKISKQNHFDARAKKALEHIDSTGEYLRNARNTSTSALIHAYQNERIQTTNLSPEKMCRWLSSTPIAFKQPFASSESAEFLGTGQLSVKQYDNSVETYQKSRLLLKKLQSHLNPLSQQAAGQINVTAVLIETWASFVGVSGESNVDALITSSHDLDDVMILLLLWLVDVSKRPGRGGRKQTAVRTVKTYMSNVAKPLIEQTIGCTFLSLSSEEFGEVYSDALDSRKIEDRAQRAENMRNFHNFVMKTYHCSPVDWFDVEPTIGNGQRDADANIISMREYSSALELLKNDEFANSVEQRVNQLILILCYRVGLRSGEASHLRLNDIDIKNWIIHVRTSYFFRTKTMKSNRRVPVCYFLSEEEKKLILEQISFIKACHPDVETPWFFSDKNSAKCLIPVGKHISRVIESLRIVTGDNSIRLHHARHSFANYLLLLMSELIYSNAMHKELKAWCRSVDISELSQKVTLQLIGTINHKERILNAISLALGHVSPSTTLRSYIHVLNLISAAENEKVLINAIDKSSLTAIVNIERTHSYKILSRGDSTRNGFLPLCTYVAKNWNGYQQLVSTRQIKMLDTLTPILTNESQLIYNQMNSVERIIRLAEAGYLATEIANALQLEFNFSLSVINATRQIKHSTGYAGTSISSDLSDVIFKSNKKKQLTASKYIKHEDFQTLLKKLSKLPESQQKEFSEFFEKYYHHRFGIVMDSSKKSQFTSLFSLIDCNVINTKERVSVREQRSTRVGAVAKLIQKGHRQKINNDNKVIHAIFLLKTREMAKHYIN